MKLLQAWALAFFLFLSFSCQQDAKNTTGNGGAGAETAIITTTPEAAPEETDQSTFKDAVLKEAQIQHDKKNNRVFVMVSGTYAKPCEHIADSKQEIDGNNIKIHLSTVVPPGAGCPDAELPMHHSIEIDTKGLKPGTYNVEVNGQKTSFVWKK